MHSRTCDSLVICFVRFSIVLVGSGSADRDSVKKS